MHKAAQACSADELCSEISMECSISDRTGGMSRNS